MLLTCVVYIMWGEGVWVRICPSANESCNGEEDKHCKMGK
jgi:hypothetical protein